MLVGHPRDVRRRAVRGDTSSPRRFAYVSRLPEPLIRSTNSPCACCGRRPGAGGAGVTGNGGGTGCGGGGGGGTRGGWGRAPGPGGGADGGGALSAGRG